MRATTAGRTGLNHTCGCKEWTSSHRDTLNLASLSVVVWVKSFRCCTDEKNQRDAGNETWQRKANCVPLEAVLWYSLQQLNAQGHSFALHVQTRGLIDPEPCASSAEKPSPCQRCVVAPAYTSKVLHLGACSNCIWSNKGARCSLRPPSTSGHWDQHLDG
jgi:hypothetical protein